MSEYYIQNGAILYTLDSTTGMTYSLVGQTTDSPIESGASVSDHYVNKPTRMSLVGTITDVKSLSSQNTLSSAEYINQLKTLKETGTPFKVSVGSNLDEIDNCVFLGINITQDEGVGSRVVGGTVVLSSYKISMSFKQVRLATPPRETTINKPVQIEVESDFRNKDTSGATTKQKGFLEAASGLTRGGSFVR